MRGKHAFFPMHRIVIAVDDNNCCCYCFCESRAREFANINQVRCQKQQWKLANHLLLMSECPEIMNIVFDAALRKSVSLKRLAHILSDSVANMLTANHSDLML